MISIIKLDYGSVDGCKAAIKFWKDALIENEKIHKLGEEAIMEAIVDIENKLKELEDEKEEVVEKRLPAYDYKETEPIPDKE